MSATEIETEIENENDQPIAPIIENENDQPIAPIIEKENDQPIAPIIPADKLPESDDDYIKVNMNDVPKVQDIPMTSESRVQESTSSDTHATRVGKHKPDETIDKSGSLSKMTNPEIVECIEKHHTTVNNLKSLHANLARKYTPDQHEKIGVHDIETAIATATERLKKAMEQAVRNKFTVPILLTSVPSVVSLSSFILPDTHPISNVEDDHLKIQQEWAARDRAIDCLQKKIEILQCDIRMNAQKAVPETKRCKPKASLPIRKRTPDALQTIQKRFDHDDDDDNDDELDVYLNQMCAALTQLQMKLHVLQTQRQELRNNLKASASMAGNFEKSNKNKKLKKIKSQYDCLLNEYNRKDKQVRELCKLLHCSKKPDFAPDQIVQRPDNVKQAVPKRHDHLDEHEDMQVLIKEQACQLEDYRDKFMAAQQKVEEQKAEIANIEMNNIRIEDQINLEIQRIKNKFQEKLKEFLPLPQLLESEQIKVAEITKQNEVLQDRLKCACHQLKMYQGRLNELNAGASNEILSEKYKLLEKENIVLKELSQKHDAEKTNMIEQLKKANDELDDMRCESAKIIMRTKDRANANRDVLQSQINRLEIELAQCRAAASLNVSDKKSYMKQMQCQLNVLGTSFDEAQLQIQSLKNHIVFLSNQQLSPNFTHG